MGYVRNFFRSMAIFLPLIAAVETSAASTYPDKPIKIVVGFPAGQSSDTVARLLANKASDLLNQRVYVDNRPGAAGIISHEFVKNSQADGYTILLGSTATFAINPTLYKKLPYDPLKDFEPIVLTSGGPLVLFTSASLPVKNVQEMVAYTKSHPREVSYGSAGNGATNHVAMEMLKKKLGIEMMHIPYKGSPPMVTDVVAGQLQFGFEPISSLISLAKTGRVKLIAIASKERSPLVPDVPTFAEQGVSNYEATPWTGLVAPKGTPPDILETLNAVFNKALKDPKVVAELQKNLNTVFGGTRADFGKFMQLETEKWGKAVKDSGAQID